MNEQLQTALAALIEKSIKAMEAGADFMAAEIPEVVQQLLLWHMTLSAIKFGAENVLAMFVDGQKGSGWWYLLLRFKSAHARNAELICRSSSS